MNARCLVDPFGYCSNPDLQPAEGSGSSYRLVHGVSVLNERPEKRPSCDPQSCGFFLSWKEEARRYNDSKASPASS
jgi:hypothetical protein